MTNSVQEVKDSHNTHPQCPGVSDGEEMQSNANKCKERRACPQSVRAKLKLGTNCSAVKRGGFKALRFRSHEEG